MSTIQDHRRRAPYRPRAASRRPASRPWIPTPLALLVLAGGGLWLAAEFELRAGVDVHGQFALCMGTGQARCVVDGDTIRYGGERIRLVGLDAPEIFSPDCATERDLGWRAANRLVDLLNEGPFRLVEGERDRDVLRTPAQDRHARRPIPRRHHDRRRRRAALERGQEQLVRLSGRPQSSATVTSITRFVALWWMRRSPFRVGLMWRTMPA